MKEIGNWLVREITQMDLTFPDVLALISLIQIWFILWVKRDEFFTGLKGKDGRWQFVELVGIAWLTLFPTVIVIALLRKDTEVWAAMEVVLFIAVAGKSYKQFIDAKFGIPQTDTAKVTKETKETVEVTTTTDSKKTDEPE